MKKAIAAALGVALLAACSGDAPGPRPGDVAVEPQALAPRYVTEPSRFDHDETMRRLYEALDQRDLTVFAVIDHAAGAAQAGLELPEATVVIFGSPAFGTPLMQRDPLMAAELPLRAAVYQDKDGQVSVATTSILAMTRAYPALSEESQRLTRIRGNLDAIVREATGRER
ncbi:DUF302 domain-containing protein [Parvularcula sp. ZS-1/3]|uniref:DUF302 domain-containing protein n=1 Tax=Parvularcula mediterranea TaxID=2732508 RepID=A0A7Y3W6E6_9PROT|nr:DUF302 domain-containing protein [Parvularcula mediterranea]NNU17649.1 DUF302 domain-containing protein [Parvularcula mediterranea]